MKYETHPDIQAVADNNEAKALAEMMLFIAEEATDADFGKMREMHLRVLYMLVDKLSSTARCINVLTEQPRMMQ